MGWVGGWVGGLVDGFPVVLSLVLMKRRSTIEVHPVFSEAPHLSSSIPHPDTGPVLR